MERQLTELLLLNMYTFQHVQYVNTINVFTALGRYGNPWLKSNSETTYFKVKPLKMSDREMRWFYTSIKAAICLAGNAYQ